MRRMPRHGWQGHGHGFRFDERQMVMGQRQRPGDYPDNHPRRIEAEGAHRRDAAHGWHPALPSRSRRGGRLRVGHRSPEAALNAAPAERKLLRWRNSLISFSATLGGERG